MKKVSLSLLFIFIVLLTVIPASAGNVVFALPPSIYCTIEDYDSSSHPFDGDLIYFVTNYLGAVLHIIDLLNSSGEISMINPNDQGFLDLESWPSVSAHLEKKFGEYYLYIEGASPAASTAVSESKYVYIYPQDEIGEYYVNEDGAKEYISYRSNDICMKFMGSESACAEVIR